MVEFDLVDVNNGSQPGLGYWSRIEPSHILIEKYPLLFVNDAFVEIVASLGAIMEKSGIDAGVCEKKYSDIFRSALR
ncbi:hypothetical protein [Brevundimonas sp.]|uniref:hypothetical protein n=1 Tax=Brevundimonas sp. TaxID=1871086 RepID=UPI002ABB896E|nr:hypothetical protein [Brevundimonas sp.]MDZ4365036.1 hypothetical protein [Brevundimonas sp.]